MATAGDIREIMDIPQDGPTKPAPKKARVETGPRLTGFQREVQSLMSDSHNVPPIPIVDNSRYKAKPTYAPRAFKTRKWEERRFVNGARTDGLELRHWKHAVPVSAGQRLLGISSNGTNVVPDGNGQSTAQPVVGNEENVNVQRAAPIRYEDEFPMEKFNVKANVPIYTPEQYEAHFKSEEWTKEETDYLMSLCRDFDLRWIVISDRYDPGEIPASSDNVVAMRKDQSTGQTNGEASADPMAIDESNVPTGNPTSDDKPSSATNGIRPPYPERSLEFLKSRYYTIASKMLSITTPPDTMTPSEFGLWEKMKNFDARTEELRKNLAEKLFMRTKEEADEERILLEELARITRNEEEFLKMRKDLYQRLETPVLSRRAEDQGTAAIYQTSSGLGALLSNLVNREKRFKRPGMIDTSRANSGQDANGEAERGTAGTATDRPRKQNWEKGQHPNQYTARRNTMDSESANGDVQPKKTGSMAQTPGVRSLAPAEEARHGVAHPQERITSGVQFRHEKASKVVLSKSAAQMAKIQAALVELGIPVRLLMPTERVSREYERLVADIVLLLDARRGVERVGSEVRVLEEGRRIRLGLPKDDKEGGDGDRMDVDEEGKAQDAAQERHNATEEQPNRDPDAEGEADDDNSNADVAVEDDEEEGANGTEANAQNENSRINSGADDNEENEDENSEDGEADENENDNGSEAESQAENGNGDAEAKSQDDEEEDDDDEEDELAASPENQVVADEDEGEEEEEEASGADDDDDDNDEEVANDDEAQEEEQQQAGDDDEGEEGLEEEKPAQPPSVPARLQKRSASVISDASRAGSNRSGVGRKKGRR